MLTGNSFVFYPTLGYTYWDLRYGPSIVKPVPDEEEAEAMLPTPISVRASNRE